MFHTCLVWVDFTASAYCDLRVQYNSRIQETGIIAEEHADDFYGIVRNAAPRLRGTTNRRLNCL